MYNEKMYSYGSNSSAIRELFEYGKKRKAEIGEDKVFDFSIGNPSVPAPSIVNDTLVKLLTESDSTKLHGYTSAAGDLKVRESIATYLNNKYKTKEEAKYIYMTAGAAASLTISLNALLNPKEEVILLAPFFPEYEVFIEKAGGKSVIVPCAKPDFQPDFALLAKAISSKTKAIIIDSPNNPTGAIFNEDTIKKISALLLSKEKEYGHDIYIISDEPYRELIYTNEEYPFVTNFYHNTIVCYSFSKSLSLPGERIGYVLVGYQCEDKDSLFKAICGAGRSLGFVCAPALFQYMIPSCLGQTSDLEVYDRNRILLYNALSEIGYDACKPSGAFYLFVKALESDAKKFSEIAKKFELLLVPSDSFGFKGYVRISYCVTTKQIENAIPAFKALYEYYQKEAK